MPAPRELRTLLEILGELEFLRPGMVLQRGRTFWPLVYASRLAKHDVARGPEWSRESLLAPEYWWEPDEANRVVIWWSTPEGPKVMAAEPGSPFVPVREDL